MKKFLKNILWFSLLLLAGGVLLELFFRIVPNNYSVKDKIIRQNYDTAEILLLGNSHSFYGFNPDIFSRPAINLANISQGLYFDELLLEKHLDSCTKAGTVVITIDYFTLGQTQSRGKDGWRKYAYRIFMGLDIPTIKPYNVKGYSIVLATDMDITRRAMKDFIKNGTLAECNTKGWAAKAGNDRLLSTPNAARKLVDKYKNTTTDFTQNLARVERIIKNCRSRGADVILVTMPVMDYYAQYADKEKVEKIVHSCTGLAQSPGVYYLNLFNDKRFTHDDFYDADHLNTGGAAKCSVLLSNYIETISD